MSQKPQRRAQTLKGPHLDPLFASSSWQGLKDQGMPSHPVGMRSWENRELFFSQARAVHKLGGGGTETPRPPAFPFLFLWVTVEF